MGAPFELAARQIALDREVTRSVPVLFERKTKRQLVSPHGFLRGTAPLFYMILAARPELAAGPAGEGMIVGDMHLENVGAYQTDGDDVVFDLNDFDDARVAPLRFDVLRLATSVILAGRTFQATACESLDLVSALIDAYAGALFARAPAPLLPAPVEELISRAKRRNRKDLLDARAPMTGGKRAFTRGERYLDLPEEIASQVPNLVAAYVGALGERAPAHAKGWTLLDAAQRVAGTGSLGCRRIALLVRDSDGAEKLYELKEARDSSVDRLLGPAGGDRAARVVAGALSLTANPPRQLAALAPSPAGSFVGRKLCPAEDKLDLTSFRPSGKLKSVVQCVGHLLGRAHARAATPPLPSAWSASEIGELIDHAVELAGSMESVHLAYARLSTRPG